MIPLFLSLSAVNLICLTAALVLGYEVSSGHREWASYHQLAGALATFACCGVHCVVFTYFIATAKWVQYAVVSRGLDPALSVPTRSFKAQAFPAALLAMAATCAAAFIGAATFSYRFSPTWHHASALLALAANGIAVAIEYRAVHRNGRLIDEVLARAGTPAEPGGPAGRATSGRATDL